MTPLIILNSPGIATEKSDILRKKQGILNCFK